MDIVPAPERILRLPEVKDRIGLSRSMVYQMVKEGKFPKPISVMGTRCVGWLESEVAAWIAERIQLRDRNKASQQPTPFIGFGDAPAL